MPTIRTKNGRIKYKAKHLYVGVKQINKELAFENLKLLKSIFDQNGLRFVLTYGTLLGVVRENDFITHDEDIDLAIKVEDQEKLLSILPQIIDNGFSIARYLKDDLLSVIRNGEYIDIYVFSDYNGKLRVDGGLPMPLEYLDDLKEIDFKGTLFYVPSDDIGALEFFYGKTWRTPIPYANFELPKWKRFLYSVRESIRYYIPTWLIKKLSQKNYRAQFDRYRKRGVLDKYL